VLSPVVLLLAVLQRLMLQDKEFNITCSVLWLEQSSECAPLAVSASVRSLCKAVRMEHPTMALAHVAVQDAGSVPPHMWPGALRALLAEQEVTARLSCGRDRWNREVERLVRVPNRIIASPCEAATPIPAGTAVITGAFGSLGTQLVTHLLATTQFTHLLLLSRSADAGAVRDRWATDDAGRVRGVRLLPLACDVSQWSAMEALSGCLDAAALPPVTAVFHCAGAVHDGPLVSLTPSQCGHVLEPKSLGAWHLHVWAQQRQLPLRSFVLFSSTASQFGSEGQAPYSAANGFLDGLASARRQCGLPAMCLQWTLWLDSGMAAGLKPKQVCHVHDRLGTLTGSAPWDVLHTALQEGDAWPAVATVSPLQLHNLPSLWGSHLPWLMAMLAPVLEQRHAALLPLLSACDPRKGKEPVAASLVGASLPEITAALAAIWADILEVPVCEVSDCHTFRAMGGHSLSRIRLVSRVRDVLKVNLSEEVLESTPLRVLAQQVQYLHFLSTSAPAGAGGDFRDAAEVVSFCAPGPLAPGAHLLFMVHPIGGSAQWYSGLAEALAPHVTVFGLQASGLLEGGSIHATVPAMAARYLSILRRCPPDVVVSVGGASFGGMVAYEMARVMMRDGERRLQGLFLIDTPDPFNLGRLPSTTGAILSRTLLYMYDAELSPADVASIDGREPHCQVEEFVRLAQARGLLPAGLEAGLVDRFVRVWKANSEAMEEYKPGDALEGEAAPHLLYFKAQTRRQSDHTQVPEAGWVALLGAARLSVAVVPGNHITMNYRPNVDTVAARVLSAVGFAAILPAPPSLPPVPELQWQLDDPDAPVAILFDGQGSQRVGMLSEFADDPAAMAAIAEASAVVGYDLWAVCEKDEGGILDRTDVCQVAVYVASVLAHGQLMRRHGWLVGRVAAYAGLSLGQYTALVAAGCMSFSQGLLLVHQRGQAMVASINQTVPSASLSIIGQTASQIRSTVLTPPSEPHGAEEDVWTAASPARLSLCLSPTVHVIGGPEAAVADAEGLCHAASITCARVRVLAAFHTPQMAPARAALSPVLQAAHFRPPATPVVCNVDASVLTATTDLPSRLLRHFTEPVLWSQSMVTVSRLRGSTAVVALEVVVGRGSGLAKLAAETPGLLPCRWRAGKIDPVKPALS